MKLLESEIGLISVGVDAPAPVGRLMPAEHSCPGLFAASGSAMAAHKNANSAMTDAEHDAHSKGTYWMPPKSSFPSAKRT